MSKLSIYCAKCGAPAFYTVKKPNFCNECGCGFSGASAPPATPSSLPAEGEQERETIPNISKLEVETQIYPHTSVSMSSVIESQRLSTTPPELGNVYEPREPSSLTPEEVMEEFKKEAGTRGQR